MIDNFKKRINNFLKVCREKGNYFFNDIRKSKALSIKGIIKVVVIIFIILISFISIKISFVENKEDLLEDVRQSLTKENAENLSKYIRYDGKRIKVIELEPLIKYYGDKKDLIDSTISELRKVGENEFFHIESKNNILGENFYLEIKKVNISFTSSLENLEINFNNKSFIVDSNNKYEVIPGIYNIKYMLKTNYGDIEGIFEAVAIENNSINIEVPARFITVYSNFEDASVFIDGMDTNKTCKEIKNYGPLPIDKSLKIFVQRDFPWGTIKSEEVDIDEDYIKLDINMVNKKLMDDINIVVNEFYSSTFNALNNKDISLIVNGTEEVKEAVYNYINENGLIFKNNYEITDLVAEIEKSDFIYDNKYKATLATNIKYNVFKKLLPFIKTPYSSSFLLYLEYENDKWNIYDIQKISVDE